MSQRAERRSLTRIIARSAPFIRPGTVEERAPGRPAASRVAARMVAAALAAGTFAAALWVSTAARVGADTAGPCRASRLPSIVRPRDSRLDSDPIGQP